MGYKGHQLEKQKRKEKKTGCALPLLIDQVSWPFNQIKPIKHSECTATSRTGNCDDAGKIQVLPRMKLTPSGSSGSVPGPPHKPHVPLDITTVRRSNRYLQQSSKLSRCIAYVLEMVR
jgi:hypothetical protein